MTISMDKTYRTACGHTVRILEITDDRDFPVGFAYKNEDDVWVVERATLEGKFYTTKSVKHDLDLVEVTPEPEYWVNVYERNDGHYDVVYPHTKRRDGDLVMGNVRRACINIYPLVKKAMNDDQR